MHFFCLYRWAKSMAVFRPKRLNNPFLWGGTFLYEGSTSQGTFLIVPPQSKPNSVKKLAVLLITSDSQTRGVLPYITYTSMCRPTGSWFWSSWFRTGHPFQRRFLERGIKNCGSRRYLLLKIVADYEEAFIWCISQTNKEIYFLKKKQDYFNLQTF